MERVENTPIIKNVEIHTITAWKECTTITGCIQGEMTTFFETRLYPDGYIETRHCGEGPDYIWTDWEQGYLKGVK